MLERILVPLDGSRLAEKALPYAQNLAQKFQSELLLVQVLPPLVISPKNNHSVENRITLLQTLERDARQYLAGVQARLQEVGIATTAEYLEGGPVAEMILELARDRAVDLIVMNTHGYSGNDLWVYGSVANKVLQQAPCPIFLVRAKGGA